MPASMAVNDQSQQRRYERKRDQHGRLWGMNIELKTGHPTGKIEFIAHIGHKQFNPRPAFVMPPVLPPQRFIKVVEGDPYRVHIDYDAWLAEATRAMKDYKRAITLEGMRIHGSQYDPQAPPSAEILAIVGGSPTAPEVVIAARQENAWIIGKSAKPDPRLEKFLVRTTRFPEADYSGLDFSGAPPKEAKAS